MKSETVIPAEEFKEVLSKRLKIEFIFFGLAMFLVIFLMGYATLLAKETGDIFQFAKSQVLAGGAVTFLVFAILYTLLIDLAYQKIIGKKVVLPDGRNAHLVGRDGDKFFFKFENGHKTAFSTYELRLNFEREAALSDQLSDDTFLIHDAVRIFGQRMSTFYRSLLSALALLIISYVFYKSATIAQRNVNDVVLSAMLVLAAALIFITHALATLAVAHFEIISSLKGKTLVISLQRLRFIPRLILSKKIGFKNDRQATVYLKLEADDLVFSVGMKGAIRLFFDEIVKLIQSLRKS